MNVTERSSHNYKNLILFDIILYCIKIICNVKDYNQYNTNINLYLLIATILLYRLKYKLNFKF